MKIGVQNFFFRYKWWLFLADVWMEYIKFEQERGDAKRVSEIYMRAVKCLDPVYTDSFVTEFSLLKTGMTVSPEPKACVY
jgi:hypothetical protein